MPVPRFEKDNNVIQQKNKNKEVNKFENSIIEISKKESSMQMKSWVQTMRCTTKNVIIIKLSPESNIESLNK